MELTSINNVTNIKDISLRINEISKKNVNNSNSLIPINSKIFLNNKIYKGLPSKTNEINFLLLNQMFIILEQLKKDLTRENYKELCKKIYLVKLRPSDLFGYSNKSANFKDGFDEAFLYGTLFYKDYGVKFEKIDNDTEEGQFTGIQLSRSILFL